MTAGPSAEWSSSSRRALVRFPHFPIGLSSSASSSLYACCSFTDHCRSMSRITRSCGPSASRVRRRPFHASDSFSFPAIASTIFPYTFGARSSSAIGSARNMPNISAHSSLSAMSSLFVAVGSFLTGSCSRHHLAASRASLPSSPFGSPSSLAMPSPSLRRSFRLCGAPAVTGNSHAMRPISFARMFTAVRPPPLIFPVMRASASFSISSASACSLISFMARTSS